LNSLRILILASGSLPSPGAARRLVVSTDVVLCADGGIHHALALGLTPQAVIGDLDSAQQSDLEALLRAGMKAIRHPPEKDETDLELALDLALEQDPSSIVILGGLGARVDHTLGNIALLFDPRVADRDMSLDDGLERVLLCRRRAEIHGRPGDVVSLIPWGAAVDGVRTDGLQWPLKDESLLAGRSRGISNVLLGEVAHIEVRSGSLLVVHRRIDEVAASAE